MSQLDDFRFRQLVAAEVAERKRSAPLDRAIVPGGAYVNAGGTGWHDANGNPIPAPAGYDEHGHKLADLEAVNAPEPEPDAPKAKAKAEGKAK